VDRRGSAEAGDGVLWIHGDGAIGAGSFFDARRLATIGDVIVVTINYRLGVFGVFGYPGLDGSGTFGLQDQRAALQWVQRNAAAFGGDPENVTLFGESYGGLATSAHLTSPESQGSVPPSHHSKRLRLDGLAGGRTVSRRARC
jgi:para-nitrobenzyl esterase